MTRLAHRSDAVEMAENEGGFTRVVVISGSVGAVIGGLLPVVLSLVGIWRYAQRGFLLTRAGERIEPGWPTWAGLFWYAILIVGGVLLIRWGVSFYRRHGTSDGAKTSLRRD